MSLKKNKRMLRYKRGTSVTGKKTSSKCMEHTNAQCKEICAGYRHSGKFLHGSRCQITREKVLQGLHLRNALKVQLNSNMKPTSGQRHKDETCDAIKYETTRLLPCGFLQAQRR
jgi:hypothetical protein